MIGIYKITNPKGQVYIGQSLNIKKRFKNYKCMCTVKSQRLLYESFVAFGVLDHKFEILTTCDKNHLNDLEREYQEVFRCIGGMGLNLRLTTSKNKPGEYSKESRKRISENQLGKKNSMFGRFGKHHPSFGIKHSDEVKKLWSSQRKGVKKSESHKINIGIPQIGELNHQAKLVFDTQTGIYYGCVKDAAIARNINRYTLSDWVNNRRGIRNGSSIILA